MSFIDSDETYYDSEEDFEPSNEEPSEEVSEEASESDIEELSIFPITAHRKKYLVRSPDFEYFPASDSSDSENPAYL